MSYQPFPIYDFIGGLQLSKEPWLLPTQAMTIAENCYFYRGRIFKRRGYEPFAKGTKLWKFQFDGGQNEPQVGDLIKSTIETTGATLVSVSVTSGSWGGNDAAGTVVVKKASLPAYADNEDLLNDTQSNTMAGGAGLGCDGSGWQHGFNCLKVPPVMCIDMFHKTGGSSELLAFDTDYLYSHDPTNDVWVIQAGGDSGSPSPDFAGDDENFFWTETWKDLFFVTNNVDYIKYWNGSALSDLHPSLDGTTLDACLLLVAYKNRLVALNTNEGGTRYPQRARSSAPGSYTDWTNDYSVDAGTVDWIRGVAFVRGELMVFFERSVWWLRYTGDPDAPFGWVQIADTEGCYAPFSTVGFEDEAISLGPTSFVGSDGLQVYNIDEKIPDLVVDMNPDKLHYAYGFAAEEWRQYLCSYPSLSSEYPDRMLCLNYVDNAFSIYDLAMYVAGYYSQASTDTYDSLGSTTYDELTRRYDDRLAVAGYPVNLMGDRTGYVWKLFTTDDDNGAAIASKFKTKRLVPYPESHAKLGYIDLIGSAATNRSLTLKVYKDFADNPFITRTVHLEDPAGRSKIRIRVRIMERGERFMIEISDNAKANPWVIDAIVPWFKRAGARK